MIRDEREYPSSLSRSPVFELSTKSSKAWITKSPFSVEKGLFVDQEN